MKTAWEIEFDFQQALAQARELDGVGSRLNELANRRLANLQQALPSYWEGDSARLFGQKEEELKAAIIKSGRSLHEEADKIRAIARRIYQAEMDALEIALRRDY